MALRSEEQRLVQMKKTRTYCLHTLVLSGWLFAATSLTWAQAPLVPATTRLYSGTLESITDNVLRFQQKELPAIRITGSTEFRIKDEGIKNKSDVMQKSAPVSNAKEAEEGVKLDHRRLEALLAGWRTLPPLQNRSQLVKGGTVHIIASVPLSAQPRAEVVILDP
jgi:hypothetical protein